jgi:hypothetical protein
MNGFTNAELADRLEAAVIDGANGSSAVHVDAAVLVAVVAALRTDVPKPGPCWHDSGIYDWALSHNPNGATIRCQLDAGHAGAHTWGRPHGGQAVWPNDPVVEMPRLCEPRETS